MRQSPGPAMTPSHSSSSPTLVPLLLAALLGGEWGHGSVCPSLPTCPDPQGPHPCREVAAGQGGPSAQEDAGSEC